jgi:lysophospholipase L1-like esterase
MTSLIPVSLNSVPSEESRILFLGDSITDDGKYLAYMDAYLREHRPETAVTFMNLGVSSETVSGLSEPDHPFPRPCVLERLGKALQEAKPDWVVMCYGMNDGIYYPYSDDRFEAFKEGYLRAIREVHEYGAKLILVTPPPFDLPSVNEDVKPIDADDREKYSFMTPYSFYTDILKRYGEWVLSLEPSVHGTINTYEPLLDYIKTERAARSDFRYGDGVHPNEGGHWVIARTLLNRLFGIHAESKPEYVDRPEQSPVFQLVFQRHRLLCSAWREHVGHTNPGKADALPLDVALAEGNKLASQIKDLLKK